MPTWSLRAALLPTLIAVASCTGEDPIPKRVRVRLDSVFDTGPKAPTPDEVREALVRQLRVAPHGGAAFPSRATIEEFYARHGHRLAWSDASGKLHPEAATLLDALRRAGDHGLVADDYGIGRLVALEKEIAAGTKDPRAADRLADFDLLATTALFRLASDLSTGRLHPDEVASDWRTTPPELDVVAHVDAALASGDLAKLLAELPPPHPGYARLQQALVKLREIEASGGWPSDPKERLGGQSIRSFQALHGIEPTGRLDDATVAALAVPVGERIRQVELNLERWRWIPRALGDPHVLVNIPGFDLELVRGGEPPWHTRVVTGKAFTPTPVLSDRIVAVVVHPAWNVPESIAVNEFLPELRKNPGALAPQGIRVLQGSGEAEKEVDARTVPWARVDADRFPYRLRQDPGGKNPLGRIKFELTNDLHIYLHDTPGEAAFRRSERDLSHGCVRVDGALELADRIASDPVRQAIREALERPEERRIDLDSKIPVHILYWTAWADEAGELHFGPDIYGLDPPQRAALDRKPYP